MRERRERTGGLDIAQLAGAASGGCVRAATAQLRGPGESISLRTVTYSLRTVNGPGQIPGELAASLGGDAAIRIGLEHPAPRCWRRRQKCCGSVGFLVGAAWTEPVPAVCGRSAWWASRVGCCAIRHLRPGSGGGRSGLPAGVAHIAQCRWSRASVTAAVPMPRWDARVVPGTGPRRGVRLRAVACVCLFAFVVRSCALACPKAPGRGRRVG